jgi:transcriptional regulator with XRE-family HTH domain
MIIVSIGQCIKNLREYRGWNQGKTAEKANISQTHLSKIERGEIATPHLSTIQELLETLGVNTERLFKRVLNDVDPDQFVDLCKEDSQFE